MSVCPGVKALAKQFAQALLTRNTNAAICKQKAQDIARARLAQGSQMRYGNRKALLQACQIQTRQLVQQIGRLGKSSRSTGQTLLCRRETTPDRRKYGMSKKIASKACVRIAVILDPGQFVRVGIGIDIRATYRQQRSQQPATALRHRSRTTNPGTTQQIEHHRLCAITAMMSQQYPFSLGPIIRAVSRPTCSAFQTIGTIPIDINTNCLKRDTPAFTQILAEVCPSISMDTQSVVDVQRLNRSVKRPEDMKQHDGIHSTRQRDNQAITCSSVMVQTVGDGSRKTLSAAGFP